MTAPSNLVTVPAPTGNAATDTANALAALDVPGGTTVAVAPVLEPFPVAVLVPDEPA